MNETKRILMAKRIERAVNDKLEKLEIKTHCGQCGHSQMVRIAHGESITIICKHCETTYGLTAHSIDKYKKEG